MQDKLEDGSPRFAHQRPGLTEKYRSQVVTQLGWVACPLIFPFALLSFYHQAYLRGSLVFIVFLALWINSSRASQRRKLVVCQEHLYLLFLLTTTVAFKELGIYMTFWCYPLPLYFQFTVQKRLSDLVAGTWWLFVTAQCAHYFPLALSLRFSISLLLVILLGRSYVKIIDGLQDELSAQATTDPLTGLLNRQSLRERLKHSWERKNRDQESASLCLLDIDFFKQVNDKFGHQKGDEVLQDISSVIRGRVRKIDQVFRYGGEEFLIILSDANLAGAFSAAESLRKLIEENCQRPNGDALTASFGIAELRDDQDIDEWVKEADSALYLAKARGRNRVEVAGEFSDAVHQVAGA